MARTPTIAPDRVLLLALPTAVSLAAWTATRDPFEAAKYLVLLVGAAVWVALTLRRSWADGRLHVSTTPWAVALAVFLSIGLIDTVLAPSIGSAFFGLPTRYSGWLLYFVTGLLGLGAARASSLDALARFTTIVLVGLLPLGLYGVIQLAGAEPLNVSSSVSGVFVTLSNPNFAGGWAGALAGVSLWQLTRPGASAGRRVLGGSALLSVLVIVVGAGSVVGFVSLGASLGVMLVAYLWNAGGSLRRLGLPVTGVVGVISAVLVSLGTYEMGPLAALGTTTGVALRRFYWAAATRMLTDNPLTGVGFDNFIAEYRIYRSAEAANAVEVVLETDAAHSVPLQLASGGGFPLALAWLAMVLIGLWALVRAVRRHEGQDSMLVAAVGSIWLGMLAQSIASFDLPSHLTMSMVSAGLMAGLAWPDAVRTITLPGVSRTTSVSAKKGRKGGKPRQRTTVAPWVIPVSTTIGVVVVGLALVAGSKPIRAESQARNGLVLARQGQFAQAATEWEAAGEVSTWEVDFPYRAGLALLQADELEPAVDAFDRALERRPQHVAAEVSAARAEVALARGDAAAARYKRALELEPNHLDLKAEAARHLLAFDFDLASRLIDEIEAADPEHPELADLLVLRERGQ